MAKSSPVNNSLLKNYQAKLIWHPAKLFEIQFIIRWSEIKSSYDRVVKEIAKKTKIKGFRPGKAPISILEKHLDKEKIYAQVFQEILPPLYSQLINYFGLKPIISPKITPLKAKEGSDWEFKAVSCEAPNVTLGEYEKKIKEINIKDKIWTPDKELNKDTKTKKKTFDEKMTKITQILLAEAKIELCEMLVEKELNHQLTALIDQINKLGMKIDDYCSAKGITPEQLRQFYQKQAEKTLKLEFILQEIAKEKKIEIDPTDIDKLIEKTTDEKTKKKLNAPLQRAYLASILLKNKVLDYLINL